MADPDSRLSRRLPHIADYLAHKRQTTIRRRLLATAQELASCANVASPMAIRLIVEELRRQAGEL